MNIDFALILTLLTVFTGGVVLVNRLAWRLEPGEGQPTALATLVEYSRSFFPVLLLVLVVRSFAFEPFRIPSGSMMPTLLQGDFIFVKKYSYGLRLPVLNAKIVETGSPERGDVVVFRKPGEEHINYIKRVIGLPGDVVRHERHRLVINDAEVPLRQAAGVDYVETLDGRDHLIRIDAPDYVGGDGEYVVPAGRYFVLGDNRDHSRDSRFIGTVPEENLVGEAAVIWLHMRSWTSWPDWGRIGTEIE